MKQSGFKHYELIITYINPKQVFCVSIQLIFGFKFCENLTDFLDYKYSCLLIHVGLLD